MKWMILITAALTILAVIGWARVRIDTSVEPMLSKSNPARQTLAFLKDSSFASKVVLWFRLTGEGGTTAELYAAADAAEKKLDPKLIARVIRPPHEADALEEVLGLLDHAGELLTAKDMAELDQLSSRAALDKRMRECYLELLKPQGSMMQAVMRRDPLGVSTRILARFYELSQGMGYKVDIKDGRLVHADGRQLLMILEATGTAADVAGSEALSAHLEAIRAAAPPGVEIVPICTQMHTAQNRALMEHDMAWAGSINSAAFLLLFLGLRRDWRIGVVFALPLATVLITIGLCALLFPTLSVVVLGMALTMAGATVDYGLFVFTGIWYSTDPRADLRRLRKPLLLCLLTTLGVFVSFLFSDVPTYRELGWMTCLFLMLSFFGALYLLPALPRPGRDTKPPPPGMPLQQWGSKMTPAVIVAGLLLAVFVVLAARVRFDSDITKLDGIRPELRQAEKDFQAVWDRSDTEKGILVVTARTRAEAEELNDQVNALMAGKIKQGRFVSLSSFWPSAAARAANQARWKQYWTPQRVADLRTTLAAAGAAYDFSTKAFDPFFQSLSDPPRQEAPDQILATIEEQFVSRAGSDWQMLNYFEDTPENLAAVTTVTKMVPGTQVVSRSFIRGAFVRSAIAESRLLVPIAVVLIIGSVFVMTRNLAQSALILLPVTMGLLGMLAVMAVMSFSINVITVVVGIFVLALITDFGIYAVVGWDRNEGLMSQGMLSMHLSGITTIIGSASLILGHHPAIFQVGVSLTAGMLIGYLTAFLVVPGLCHWRDRRKKGGTA
jgi:uncharacterized protein